MKIRAAKKIDTIPVSYTHLAKGESVSDVDTGALWYNKDNMEDANIKPCLYE